MELDTVCTWVEQHFQLGDRRRARALAEMSWGLAKADKISFAAIGRQMESLSTAASEITRVYKFCHNERVDPGQVQAALVQQLAGRAATVIEDLRLVTVAVDWHSYDNGRMSGLRVSLMTGTRALPLLWYEIEASKLGGVMSEMERKAVQDLIRLRPPGVTWLVLLDAGFRSPDLIRLLDTAGYYIVRSATSTLFHPSASACWTRVGDLPVSVGQIVEFGWGHLSRQNPIPVRLVGARLYDAKPPKPRRQRSTTHRYKYKTPGLCVVATNLPCELVAAPVVIRLYSRRFEIEHNFRDIKNASVGMDMDHVHLRESATYARLMCIVAVTEAILWLAGAAAEAQGIQLTLTPSRPRNKRRILSLRRTGALCLRKVEGAIALLLERHLVGAIASVINVTGRTWKDCSDVRRVRGTARVRDATPHDRGRCFARGGSKPTPCIAKPRWNLVPDGDRLPQRKAA